MAIVVLQQPRRDTLEEIFVSQHGITPLLYTRTLK
jgi:hypothetical protein